MSLQDKVEEVQRRSARFIASEYSCEVSSMSTLLKDLCLGTLFDRYGHCRLQILAKGIYGQANILLSGLCKLTCITRYMHAMHYRPPNDRTNYFKYSFIPNTIQDWNGLPSSLIEGSLVTLSPLTLSSIH